MFNIIIIIIVINPFKPDGIELFKSQKHEIDTGNISYFDEFGFDTYLMECVLFLFFNSVQLCTGYTN